MHILVHWCTSCKYVCRKYFIDIIVIIIALVLWHVLYHWHGAVKNLYPLYFSCPIKLPAPILVGFGNLKFKHVEWYWCFSYGQCYSPLFKKENENLFLDQGMVQMKTTIHTHTEHMTDLRLSEPNYYKIFLRLDGLSFAELLAIVTPYSHLKNMWEKQSLSAFIHYAGLFGHWKWFWRPEIHMCYVSSVHWRPVYCLADTW